MGIVRANKNGCPAVKHFSYSMDRHSHYRTVLKIETIKEELDFDVKANVTLRNRDGPSSLWEGEVKVKLEKEHREIQIPVQIFHKDDAKNGQKLFDWTIGSAAVGAIKYPMALLGSKSSPQLKHLKPFIKDSHIVQIVCKDLKQHEMMVNELQDVEGEKNFFLADPDFGTTPLVIVTVNMELYGSCVSLISTKDVLASYEEFRSHLSNNIVENSWNADFDEISERLQGEVGENTKDILQREEEEEEESTSNEVTSSDIQIQNSWSEADVGRSGKSYSKDNGSMRRTDIRAQAVDKPFICTQCDYSCFKSDKLARHMRKHTGEKPYHCTQCDYCCAHSSELKRHMRIHTGEKPFQCTQCDYSCVQSSHLKVHMRRHTGEKPYQCTQCDFSCAQSGDFKRHMRTHTGEKPFQCTQCDYSSVQSSELKIHMRRHNG